MAQRSSRQRFLIIFISLAIVGVLALLIYSFASQAPTSQAPQPADGGGEGTARQALSAAQELVAQWQSDARLSGVTGQQLDVVNPSTLDMAWSFQFYSPSTQRLALIAVAHGTAKMVRSPALSPYPVTTFSGESWQIDSDRALDIWLAQGGSSMIAQHKHIDLMMQLRVIENDQLAWTVTGIAVKTNTTFPLIVDAVDGSVSRP